ncbi:hypothetical protein CBFG_03115 [Clostridiales bacterium 1_7_47FAA]|nr:hypothetical protein CBFG_03115 [Clostridiales bacterium 1_7_47FAA]
MEENAEVRDVAGKDGFKTVSEYSLYKENQR